MAERHPLCNCDAPMPANLCMAVCFERRNDVAGVPPSDPTRVSPGGPRGQLTAAFSSSITSILQVTAHTGELS